jgi:hypothetical protein
MIMKYKFLNSIPIRTLFLFSFKTLYSFILSLALLLLSACSFQEQSNSLSTPTQSSIQVLGTPAINEIATPETTEIIYTSIPPTPSSVSSDQKPIAQMTHDGVSVEVTWTYADADRIGIEYHVKGVQIPNGYQMYCPVHYASLTDDTGRKEYEPYVWPFPKWPPENFTSLCQRDSNGQDFTITQNYYRELIGDIQAEQLTWKITVGGFDIFTKTGDHTWLPEREPFLFNLTVPMTNGLTMKSAQTMSKNGLTVRLNLVAIYPTYTDAFMCIYYDNSQGWYPDITLTKDENSVQFDDAFRTDVYHKSFPTFMSQFTPERCYRYSFNIPSPEIYGGGFPQSMVLTFNNMTINALDAATEQDYYNALRKVQSIYPDLDFSVNIHNSDPQKYGFGFQINKIPKGMDYATAQQIAEDGFISIVEGPISFEISAP